ncbi:MAG: FAD-dependent oxidoreductase [Gemmatimonadetes bacterium]|nr:FAD-dependent oxidoreductase [Gemmatimonadota bacterium]
MSVASNRVIVIGGGIAGLVAAIELERRGRPVLLLEQHEELGGRVRSRRVDGFRIDRGFQVLFTAYPVLTRYLDLTALDLHAFQPAARIASPTGTSVLGDALRDPSVLAETVLSSHVRVSDVWRLLRLRRLATHLDPEACFAPEFANMSTREFLEARGFGDATIDRFFAPFYGGILLDRSLESSAAVLLFTFRMLALGETALPARGMGAIALQLRERLRLAEVRTGVRVTALRAERGRTTGVEAADGTVHEASDVVLATEAPVARTLAATAGVTLEALPTRALGCATVYLASETPVLPGRALTLNAADHAVISHAVTVSDVAPSYAPPGQHLVAMTAVGEAALIGDSALERAAISELAMMRRSGVPGGVRLVAIERVPYSQFAHPPGYASRRPIASTPLRGLWLGGEALHSSSLDGAARSGVAVADAITGAEVPVSTAP